MLRKKDLKGTLDAAEALDLRLKGDPYLDVIRARAHLAAGDPESARAYAEKAVGAEPDLAPGWRELAGACLALKDFKAVAETLSKIEGELKVKLGDLEGDPAYAEFVKSKEYDLWRGSRKK